MYAEMIQERVADQLLKIITDVINDPDYSSQDGFIVFIEICHRKPETVMRIQRRAFKASAKEGKQFDPIADLPKDLDEYLPPSESIVKTLEQKYYQKHG